MTVGLLPVRDPSGSGAEGGALARARAADFVQSSASPPLAHSPTSGRLAARCRRRPLSAFDYQQSSWSPSLALSPQRRWVTMWGVRPRYAYSLGRRRGEHTTPGPALTMPSVTMLATSVRRTVMLPWRSRTGDAATTTAPNRLRPMPAPTQRRSPGNVVSAILCRWLRAVRRLVSIESTPPTPPTNPPNPLIQRRLERRCCAPRHGPVRDVARPILLDRPGSSAYGWRGGAPITRYTNIAMITFQGSSDATPHWYVCSPPTCRRSAQSHTLATQWTCARRSTRTRRTPREPCTSGTATSRSNPPAAHAFLTGACYATDAQCRAWTPLRRSAQAVYISGDPISRAL